MEALMLSSARRVPAIATVACALFVSHLTAQGPAPDPLVKVEGLTKVGDHTYVIPDGNVSLVPNVGIVVGTRATLVIDPGLGRRNGEVILREARRLSPNNELFIASTHFHPEHTTGYVAFPASAKYVNSTTQETEFEQSGAGMIKAFSGRSAVTGELLADAVRRPADVTFDREYALDLGGVRVRFFLVGPTHTRGDTGLFVEGDRVLFAGDVVMNESFLAAGPGSSVKAWLAAFDTFGALEPRTLVPAHGAVGPGTVVAANRAWVQALRDRALALKSQGQSLDETAAAVQKEFQAQHPAWPRANGLAALARSAYEGR
uniref:Beta-lactamase domain-containing protein n=1 Tax=uncultured bacterium 126 TaxID=698379 RepID=E3T718_9BACT|nr:beta-lactamase domain-containing protein [uncultured bacterium 126]